MKTKNQLTALVLALAHSKWLQAAVFTLVVAVVLIGVSGCKPVHH